LTGVETVSVVQFVRARTPHAIVGDEAAEQLASRERRGRLYSTVIVVAATFCVTDPC
jgi:hypothetical protein